MRVRSVDLEGSAFDNRLLLAENSRPPLALKLITLRCISAKTSFYASWVKTADKARLFGGTQVQPEKSQVDLAGYSNIRISYR